MYSYSYAFSSCILLYYWSFPFLQVFWGILAVIVFLQVFFQFSLSSGIQRDSCNYFFSGVLKYYCSYFISPGTLRNSCSFPFFRCCEIRLQFSFTSGVLRYSRSYYCFSDFLQYSCTFLFLRGFGGTLAVSLFFRS